MEKQAILIIAHNNINILKYLIKSLDYEYFDIYLHLDSKCDIAISDLKDLCKNSGLHIYKKINVKWATYSQVECELLLLEKAFNNNNYKYYHLISGTDMPLHSSEEIFNFFNNNYPKEFVHFENKHMNDKKIEWIKYYHLFRGKSRKNVFFKVLNYISISIQKIFKINRLSKDTMYYTGAQWFSITKNFAQYILKNKNNIATMFKYTNTPDEFFIQTILGNSEYFNNLYYNKLDNNYQACMRLIDWNRGCPYTYTINDWEELSNSNFMFARKFDEKVDFKIVENLYNKLLTDRKVKKHGCKIKS